MILAHRGDSFLAPENTLEAARLGLESGADGWELDVQLTRDGVPVVFHDPSLTRTTDVSRTFAGDPRQATGFLVADFTAAEIARLDAGSWFVDPSGGPRSAAGFGTIDRLCEPLRALYASGRVRVPTLVEALAITSDLDALVNVEIKPTSGEKVAVVDAVLSEIRAARVEDLVTVSSFDHEVVSLIAARAPEVATGALVESLPESDLAAWLRSIGADALHAPASVIGPSTEGVPTLVYTVNDARPTGLAWQLSEKRVAGLFTDDPTSMAIRFGITPSARRTRPR